MLGGKHWLKIILNGYWLNHPIPHWLQYSYLDKKRIRWKKSRPDQGLLRQNRQESMVPRVQARAAGTEKREMALKGIKEIKIYKIWKPVGVLGERKKDV